MAAKKKGKWVAGATKNAHGQFAAKAKEAGMSTAAYAKKEEHAKGELGEEARLAETLMGLSHKRKKALGKMYPSANH